MYRKVLLRCLSLWVSFLVGLFLIVHEHSVGQLTYGGMQKSIYLLAILTIVVFWLIIFRVASEYKASKRQQK